MAPSRTPLRGVDRLGARDLAGLSGRSADEPEYRGARARESCAGVCAYCVKHLSYGPSRRWARRPRPEDRTLVRRPSVERGRRPKAEGRKPKAAGSTGPLIKVRCRKCITAAPCRAAANTAPPLTIGAPNRIPLAYADRYGYYTQNATITLRVWRVKARCSGSYRSNDRRISRCGSRTSARAESYVGAH